MLRQLAFAAVLACGPLMAAAQSQGVQQPIKPPVLGTDTVHGCYSSKGSLDDGVVIPYNSQGKCNILCRDKLKKSVAATYSGTCYCGDEYPASSSLIAPGKCNEPCPGFGDEACGGLNAFTVYNSGLRVSVGEAPADTTSSAVPTTATSAPPVTSSTTAPTPTPTPPPPSGPPTVAIAVGVVVGILVIAGVAGGVFFYMRRKRNTEIEEEHRRNAAVNAFISGGKPPGSSDGMSMSDCRLDPVIANRRMSDGSIADNQDYSRRILRVTNA